MIDLNLNLCYKLSMGWTGTYLDKRPTADEIRKQLESEWMDGEIKRASKFPVIRSNVAYGIAYENGKPVCILVVLHNYKRGEWSYKDISEISGPVQVDCPLWMLAEVPCPDSKWAREWRIRVKRESECKLARKEILKTLAVKDRLIDKCDRTCTVVSIAKQILVEYDVKPGKIFSLPKSWIKERAT